MSTSAYLVTWFHTLIGGIILGVCSGPEFKVKPIKCPYTSIFELTCDLYEVRMDQALDQLDNFAQQPILPGSIKSTKYIEI